ncbi:bacteriohemerythrin [Mariprofundus sp. NF]|uniref:bacteriohemerythrin n=1 Tax=Mariprofundus sp. NF TaxID=2608716 RepID=UPI00180E2B03|nr:bacteriohemerythrin [Mariprofundus sp. NF]NWF37728.1 bacteriohemerythrin [Mariprofundus sp. NF]
MEVSPWRIEWSDELSMSNSEIDAEHRNFIRLVNELNNEIMSQQRDKAVVVRILNQILDDAIAHFAHEERLFIEKSYPAREEHAQLHAELISKFKQALKDIHATEYGRIWIATGLEIRSLLVNHVLFEDTQYIEYLRTE